MLFKNWDVRDKNLIGDWKDRPEFRMENDRTGEVLRFARVRIFKWNPSLLHVFVLYRYSKKNVYAQRLEYGDDPFSYGTFDGRKYIERLYDNTLKLTKKKLKFFNRAA